MTIDVAVHMGIVPASKLRSYSYSYPYGYSHWKLCWPPGYGAIPMTIPMVIPMGLRQPPSYGGIPTISYPCGYRY